MTQPSPAALEDARSRLADEDEAHLGYMTGHGRQHLVVRYALCDDRLVFRLPAYSSALGYAPDQPVTMAVPVRDRLGANGGHLLVSGTASVVNSADCARADTVLDEHWPPGVVTRVLALTLTEIEHVPAEQLTN
jgi:hypothetical protein